MSIFKELDELAQTGTVIIIFILLVSVIYLLWNLSPKVFGLLMFISGAVTLYFSGFSMKAHQVKPFFAFFMYMGIIFIIVGLLLVLFM